MKFLVKSRRVQTAQQHALDAPPADLAVVDDAKAVCVGGNLVPWMDSFSAANVAHILTAGLQAFDLLGIGRVVCNVFGQFLVANRTAEELLAMRDGLEVSSDRVLRALEFCDPPLEEVIQRVANSALSGRIENSNATVLVRRSSNQRSLILHVRSVASASKVVHSTQPAALVLIVDPALPVRTSGAELQQLYGLTPTEARFANLLMDGSPLVDCCEELGIRRATGHTHLKGIFRKTGVRRQSELAALLLRSIGLAKLGNPKTTSKRGKVSRIRHGCDKLTPRWRASAEESLMGVTTLTTS